jgi:hypothetical protein
MDVRHKKKVRDDENKRNGLRLSSVWNTWIAAHVQDKKAYMRVAQSVV